MAKIWHNFLKPLADLVQKRSSNTSSGANAHQTNTQSKRQMPQKSQLNSVNKKSWRVLFTLSDKNCAYFEWNSEWTELSAIFWMALSSVHPTGGIALSGLCALVGWLVEKAFEWFSLSLNIWCARTPNSEKK